MRELDEKEDTIKSVQDKAERLMLKNHPARLTIEVRPMCYFLYLGLELCRQLQVVSSRQFSSMSDYFASSQAYKAAMQTQWSWILQLCSCVEQHLKGNAVYFEVSCTLKLSY